MATARKNHATSPFFAKFERKETIDAPLPLLGALHPLSFFSTYQCTFITCHLKVVSMSSFYCVFTLVSAFNSVLFVNVYYYHHSLQLFCVIDFIFIHLLSSLSVHCFYSYILELVSVLPPLLLFRLLVYCLYLKKLVSGPPPLHF
jgi:hypothetical protein